MTVEEMLRQAAEGPLCANAWKLWRIPEGISAFCIKPADRVRYGEANVCACDTRKGSGRSFPALRMI